MRFSLGRFWPRAESKLYEEPKKLVRHGLATSTAESSGQRHRTRYAITDEGRTALRTWLATTPQPPTLEAEPLLRVFLAEHGTRADLVATLEAVRSWAAKKLVEDARIARDYRDAGGPFPARIAQVTLVGRFLSDFALMSHDWADGALRAVAAWPKDIDRATADRDALDVIIRRGEHLVDEATP